MRTETIVRTVYNVRELQEHCPDGFRRAFERHCRWQSEDPPWQGEIADSLKAALRAIEGAPNIDGPTRADDVRRCMAWLENNVLGPLRISWHGARRWKVARYGPWYRPGCVEPCPWTGVCFDEDLLDAMRSMAKEGRSPHEWARALRDVADRLCEREVEGACTEDAFIDDAEANGREFYSDGGVA